MRAGLWLLVLVGVPACGVVRYLPRGPVVDSWARSTQWPATAARVDYTGPARFDGPLVPLAVWGVAYDRDLVLVDHHPAWEMHELARIPTPDGPVWIAKEARRGTRAQEVTSALPDLDAWLPELPVVRHAAPLEVDDRSTDRRLDLTARWTDPDGRAVVLEASGPVPARVRRLRNGPTFGHSRDALLAVLDIPSQAPLTRAALTIDGERQRWVRLAGLVPFTFTLVQTQGGLATGAWESQATASGVETVWTTPSGRAVALPWTRRSVGDRMILTQADPLRTTTLIYRVTADAEELSEASVRTFGSAADAVHLQFSPALPDLRRPFAGVHTSRYVVDLAGQPGHAVGRVEAQWVGDAVQVDVLPTAPVWTTDRPLRATITFAEGRAQCRVVRLPSDVDYFRDPPAGGSHE